MDRLAGPEALAEVRETLQGLNAEAKLVETVRCQIDLAEVLHRKVFDAERTGCRIDAMAGGQDFLLPEGHQTVLDVDGQAIQGTVRKSAPPKHRHDTNIRTIRLELPGQLSHSK